MKHIRIFITPSHICTTYITLFARHTHQDHHIDILFPDASRSRKSLAVLIREASTLHQWDLYHDFSLTEEESFSNQPGTRKSITRKLRNWPVLKTFYNALLKRYMKKQDALYRQQLNNVLQRFSPEHNKVDIFALTQTYLNRPLGQLFPSAEMNHVEHGIGDYYMLANGKIRTDDFYCVFAERFTEYIRKQQPSADWIHPLPLDNFKATALQLLELHKRHFDFSELQLTHPRVVLILLESVEMYEVPDAFWTQYLDRIFARLDDPSAYHYLLKPHPMQSEHSLRLTHAHLQKLGYSWSMPSGPVFASISAEVLFASWEEKVEHVFCLFSSANFYLSQLYRGSHTRFWYSTEFMRQYMTNAPETFRKHFEGLCPIIENVFTENCRPF